MHAEVVSPVKSREMQLSFDGSLPSHHVRKDTRLSLLFYDFSRGEPGGEANCVG